MYLKIKYLSQLVAEGYIWKWTGCTSSLQCNWCRVEGDGLRSGVFDFYLQSKGRNEPLTPVAVGVLVPLLKVWVWIHHSVSFSLSLNIVCFIWITVFLSLALYLDFMGHYCVLMMTSGVPTKFFLWWELQDRKMRGRLTRLEVCVIVGRLWENCWGSCLI